ncbi:hypothetical protein [Arcobacter peruensis]|uniref:hypothetical protein n=1 Tax=Arcobacter peruensis TaxID=2320140 RepID=UPI000F079D2C|nr:hypothetical protein [Arcobacter peruensis]
MIRYYGFKEIRGSELYDKQKITKNHKFLYESVNSEINYYKSDDIKMSYINYFKKIFFEIKELESKSKKADFFAYHISGDKKDISNMEISKLLRNSDTLKINESNCYDNKDIKVVFSENGFVFIAKFDEQIDKFERIYILYLLAQAYNLYTEKLMMDVSSSYKNENFNKMLTLRKEIYSFDLSCFFSNPVNYKKQQMHTIWSFLHDIYSVEENHKEMKSQVEDLVNLIEIDIREKEKEERIKEKEKEERLYRQRKEERVEENEKQNKKAFKRTMLLTGFGVLIAMFSLGSVYADLVELGALPNIFEVSENKVKDD